MYASAPNYRPTSITFDSLDRLFIASRNGVVSVVEDSDADEVGDRVDVYDQKGGMALGLALAEKDRTLFVVGEPQWSVSTTKMRMTTLIQPH